MIDIPIPKLRDDLIYNTMQFEGQDFYIVYDEIGLVQEYVAFKEDELSILKLINGINSVEEISNLAGFENSRIFEILNFVKRLSNLNLIETDLVKKRKAEIENYLKCNIKEAVCSGVSYPSKKEDLETFLDSILKTSSVNEGKYNVIFAPHLDFRTDLQTHITYAKAFNSIDIENTEIVILFGTAHFRSSGDFMYTRKYYKTPLGIIETDLEFLDKLESKINVHYDDLAHYNEHSLELHIIFLQHLLNKNVKIVPILIGSPHQYFQNSYPDKNYEYSKNIDEIRKLVLDYNKKTLFLASGDLSHIGMKFGDNFDAIDKKSNIINYDIEFIDVLNKRNKNEFFDFARNENEIRKVCGVFPFYAMLDLTEPYESKSLYYNFWYEKQTKSSVSICSMGMKSKLP